jgi:hypothetical protein
MYGRGKVLATVYTMTPRLAWQKWGRVKAANLSAELEVENQDVKIKDISVLKICRHPMKVLIFLCLTH